MRQQTEDYEENVLGGQTGAGEVLAGGQEQVNPGDHGQQDTATLPADRQHRVERSRGTCADLARGPPRPGGGGHRSPGILHHGHLTSNGHLKMSPDNQRWMVSHLMPGGHFVFTWWLLSEPEPQTLQIAAINCRQQRGKAVRLQNNDGALYTSGCYTALHCRWY